MLVITAALTQDGDGIASLEGPATFDKTVSVISKQSVRLPDVKWNLTFCYVDPRFSYLHFPSGSTLTGGVHGLKEELSDFLARVKVRI